MTNITSDASITTATHNLLSEAQHDDIKSLALKGYLESMLEKIALEQMGVTTRPLRKLVQLMDGKKGWHVTFTLQSVFDYAIDVHAIDTADSFDMATFVNRIRTSIDVIGDCQDNVEYSTEHIYSKQIRLRLLGDAYDLYQLQQLYVAIDVQVSPEYQANPV